MTATTTTTSESLTRYAAVVWSPQDLIEIRALPSIGGNGRAPQSLWMEARELPDHADQLTTMNTDGFNIFAGVLPRKAEGGASDKDTLAGWVAWADCDHVDPREAWKTVIEVGLPKPTMAIGSGHGLHPYWRFRKSVSPKGISELVGDIASLIQSDSSVRNPSRILRVPGFQNLKKPVTPCQLLFYDYELQYDFNELRSRVPATRRQGSATGIAYKISHRRGHDQRSGDILLERGRRYAATVQGSGPGGRTNTAFRLAAALLNDLSLNGSDALTILEDWDSRVNTPSITTDYGKNELHKILKNAAKYHKQPPGRLHASKQPHIVSGNPDCRIPLPTEQESVRTTLAAEFEAEAQGLRNTLLLPWPRLTQITKALRPGSVTILAGPSGHGKSIFALQLAAHIHNQGEDFSYLILEDRKADFERRILAHLSGNWDVIDDDVSGATKRMEILAHYESQLADLAEHVGENPRIPTTDSAGNPTVPPLPYQKVLDWAGRALTSSRVVFIDPIAQIDFGENKEWKGQADFMRQITGLSAFHKSSVFLVCHTVKRGGFASRVPLSGEDIQGAAEIKRLSHTILLLDVHEETENAVWREGGNREYILHDRTVIVDKARNGTGKGNRLAFNMNGPAFQELGVLAPKEKTDTSRIGGNPSDRAYKD